METAQELLNAKLRKAAGHGTPDDIKKALAEGAEINSRDREEGWSALHLAVLFEKNDNIDTLLATPGIIVNTQDNQKATPLHYAAGKEDNVVVVKALIAKDKEIDPANGIIDARDKILQTALHHAAYRNRADSSEALVEAGADLGAKDRYNRTPRALASGQHPPTAEAYLKGEEEKRKDQPWTDKTQNGASQERQ